MPHFILGMTFVDGAVMEFDC